MPGMLMSDKIKISEGSRISTARCSATGADGANSIVKRPSLDVAAELLTEQGFDVGLVIDDEDVNAQFLPPAFTCVRRIPRQRNDEFGEQASFGIDIDCAAVLFHHDVVAHR